MDTRHSSLPWNVDNDVGILLLPILSLLLGFKAGVFHLSNCPLFSEKFNVKQKNDFKGIDIQPQLPGCSRVLVHCVADESSFPSGFHFWNEHIPFRDLPTCCRANYPYLGKQVETLYR